VPWITVRSPRVADGFRWQCVAAFGRRFADSRPDLILVQGDTTTAMAGALAGFYAKVPVAHVEAGLRSGDLANPFPEEANRQIIDAVSTILLPPTPQAQANLLRAGFTAERCPVTGNTVVDALATALCNARPRPGRQWRLKKPTLKVAG